MTEHNNRTTIGLRHSHTYTDAHTHLERKTWCSSRSGIPQCMSSSRCVFCFNRKLQVGVPAGLDVSIGPAEAANAHQFFLPTFIRSPEKNMTGMDSEPLCVNLQEFHHAFLQQTPFFPKNFTKLKKNLKLRNS